MTDQTEEPMGHFVDAISDQALEQLGPMQRQLSTVLLELEKSGPDYARPFRLLLASEAALEHSVAALHQARAKRHQAWQTRQQAAIVFLEVRAAGFRSLGAPAVDRRFRVRDDRRTASTAELLQGGQHGARYRNIPPIGTEFTFTLERVASLTGGRHGLKARLHALGCENRENPAEICVWEMPLQALHQAFQDGAIEELTLESHPRRGRSDMWHRNDPDLIPPAPPTTDGLMRANARTAEQFTKSPLRTFEPSDDPANRDRIEELRLHLAEDDGMPPISRDLLAADAADQGVRRG